MGLNLAEIPACLGNCNGGRRACTLPRVCPGRPEPGAVLDDAALEAQWQDHAQRRLTVHDLDRAIARNQRPLPAPLAVRQRGPRRIAAERRRRALRLRIVLLAAALALTLTLTLWSRMP